MPLSNLPRRAFRHVVPLVAVAFAVTAGTVAAARSAQAGTAECELRYSVVSPPDNGPTFQAEVTVRNIGSARTTGWIAYIYLTSRTRVVDSWNSVENSILVGPVVLNVFANASWNGVMAPGEQRTFGFIAAGDENIPLASACSVS